MREMLMLRSDIHFVILQILFLGRIGALWGSGAHRQDLGNKMNVLAKGIANIDLGSETRHG